jgi:hypothetical protein
MLLHNPALVVPPLLTQIAIMGATLVFSTIAGLSGILGGWLWSLAVTLVSGLGLAVSIMLADRAWSGPARLSQAWERAHERMSDILLAALGFAFVQSVADFFGGILGSVAFLLHLAAVWAFIFAIPAAAIGGIPGGAALQISLERVQRNPLNAALLGILYITIAMLLETLVFGTILRIVSLPPLVSSLINALTVSLANAYLALVLAKSYTDVSFGRIWR